jgi:hypothetical protein
MKAWRDQCRIDDLLNSKTYQKLIRLPTRLVDIASLPNSSTLANIPGSDKSWRNLFQTSSCRLIDTFPGEADQYCTLSYCWGPALPYMTTTQNLGEHRTKLQFGALPRTLQDAIMMARFLDFNYIWIDCLCICQDDEEDWAQEAARMADVYDNATICIAASRAKDCNSGFLQARQDESFSLVPFQDTHGTFNLYLSHDRGVAPHLYAAKWMPTVSSIRNGAINARALSYNRCNILELGDGYVTFAP